MTPTQPTAQPTIVSAWVHAKTPKQIEYIALTANGKKRRLWESVDTAWGKVLRSCLHPAYEQVIRNAEKSL